jgi:hypothetical protein
MIASRGKFTFENLAKTVSTSDYTNPQIVCKEKAF